MHSEKIVNIKPIGKMKTLDIEIKHSSHVFYANGIATSNSHSVSYGIVGYWTAWAKTHFPLHFYTCWLELAKEKIDPKQEIQELVLEAKLNSIDIKPPSLTIIHKGDPGSFCLLNDSIYFGINKIKGVGGSSLTKLISVIKAAEEKISKKVDKWNWLDFLFHASVDVGKVVVNGLIHSGALSYFLMQRTAMINEYNIWRQLTSREQDFIAGLSLPYTSFVQYLKYMLENFKVTSKRTSVIIGHIENLENPKFSQNDAISFISSHENAYLGIPLSCNAIDETELGGDTTCKEFADGKNAKKMSIVAEIISAREHTIKGGKNPGKVMAFLSIKDDTGSLSNVLAFPDLWASYKHEIYPGQVVVLVGDRFKDAFSVKSIRV